MAGWTSLDWRALNFGIMLSTKSSIILDTAYASAESSQRAAWLGKCLDTLCLRAQELHRLKGDDCSYFLKLAHDWTSIKTFHQSCIQRTSASSATVTTAQHQQQPVPAPNQQQQTSNIAYAETLFDIDPFNEVFWAGFRDTEAGMAAMYSI